MKEPKFICNLCYPDVQEIAELGDNLWLVKIKDRYSLIGYQGHKDDEYLFFDEKPIPDPDPDEREDLSEEEGNLADKWLEMVDRLEEKLVFRAEQGYYLVKCCREKGYGEPKTTCRLAIWLMEWCGKQIMEFEKNECNEILSVR